MTFSEAELDALLGNERNECSAQKPVTIEALEAAAKLAGEMPQTIYGQQQLALMYRTALARLIMETRPELIAKSFDDRTQREWYDLRGGYADGLEQYRKYVRQYQDEAKA
jgi:hypothetical protein